MKQPTFYLKIPKSAEPVARSDAKKAVVARVFPWIIGCCASQILLLSHAFAQPSATHNPVFNLEVGTEFSLRVTVFAIVAHNTSEDAFLSLLSLDELADFELGNWAKVSPDYLLEHLRRGETISEMLAPSMGVKGGGLPLRDVAYAKLRRIYLQEIVDHDFKLIMGPDDAVDVGYELARANKKWLGPACSRVTASDARRVLWKRIQMIERAGLGELTDRQRLDLSLRHPELSTERLNISEPAWQWFFGTDPTPTGAEKGLLDADLGERTHPLENMDFETAAWLLNEDHLRHHAPTNPSLVYLTRASGLVHPAIAPPTALLSRPGLHPSLSIRISDLGGRVASRVKEWSSGIKSPEEPFWAELRERAKADFGKYPAPDPGAMTRWIALNVATSRLAAMSPRERYELWWMHGAETTLRYAEAYGDLVSSLVAHALVSRGALLEEEAKRYVGEASWNTMQTYLRNPDFQTALDTNLSLLSPNARASVSQDLALEKQRYHEAMGL